MSLDPQECREEGGERESRERGSRDRGLVCCLVNGICPYPSSISPLLSKKPPKSLGGSCCWLELAPVRKQPTFAFGSCQPPLLHLFPLVHGSYRKELSCRQVPTRGLFGFLLSMKQVLD